MQGLLQGRYLYVDAEQAYDLPDLGDGLGQGDHLPFAGKILIGARQRGVLGGRVAGQCLLPVRLVVDAGVETKFIGGHPGVEIDEVVGAGEIDPGHGLVQQLAGGREQGREAERQVYSGLPFAARGGQGAQPGQVADEGRGQIDGDAIQAEVPARIGLQRRIKLAREGRLGVAAQPLFGLAAHGLEKGLHSLVLAAELGRGIDDVTPVQLGDLAQGVLQGEQQQQHAQSQQQPLQPIFGKGMGQCGHGAPGR
ncbi:hypothetical protein D3C76_935100 [compost metagenome]